MPAWFWAAGWGLCGLITAAWYLRRVSRSASLDSYLQRHLSAVPPWVPRPGLLFVIGLVVLWPIPVLQHTFWGSAFRGEPHDRSEENHE